MSIAVYSISAVTTPDVQYVEPTYIFKQNLIKYDQGFTLNSIDALSNVYDTSINNYDSFYLTNSKALDNFLTIDENNVSQIQTITTSLVFDLDQNTQSFLALQVNNDNTTFFTLVTSFKYTDNNLFYELEFIDDTLLRILHNTNKGYFTLNAIGTDRAVLSTHYSTTIPDIGTDTAPDIFRYTISSSGYLTLYKNINNFLFFVSLSGSSLALLPVSSINLVSERNKLFNISYTYDDIQPKLKSSWVSYKNTKLNTLELDSQYSNFEQSNQYLLHTNYTTLSNNTLTFNYITLNNHKSEKHFQKRGSSLIEGDFRVPDTDFREYITLNTGNSQELGNDNISLVYVWYDKDILVKNNATTFFTTTSSVYPYDQININDTKFVNNGAFAATIPALADKIFALRTQTSTFNNGRYLCTWLSGGGNRQRGVWVDRYFYPDRLSKDASITVSSLLASNLDPIDDLEYNTGDIFFDKRSDLTIQPNTRYKYERIGAEDITTFLNTKTPIVSSIDTYFDTNNTGIQSQGNTFNFDGAKYLKYNIQDTIKCSKSFTISFDMLIDSSKQYGYSILNSGSIIQVINDKRITPFNYVYQDNILYMYNTDNVLIASVSFEYSIREVIPDKALAGIYVVVDNGILYKLNSNGSKVKRESIAFINYLNYTQDDSYLYFLISEAGNCKRVNKITFEVDEASATLPPTFTTQSTLSACRSLYIYNNTLYGIIGQNTQYKSETEIYSLLHNKQLWVYNFTTDQAQILYQTTTKTFNDYCVDTSGNITIITDTSAYQYNPNRVFVLSATSLFNSISNTQNISIDIVREYTPQGVVEYPKILCLIDPLSSKTLGSYNLYNGNVYTYPITGRYVSDTVIGRRKYTLTNFNRVISYNDKTIDFNATLTNYLLSEDVVTSTISIPQGALDSGYHTFTYSIDTIKGTISLFIDGALYEQDSILPGKYAIQNTLDTDIYFGTVGFYNSSDLATFLSQPGYYFLKDASIKNLYLFDIPASKDIIFALNVVGSQIDDLILSIPCGQRNNIEEIQRLFKYGSVSSSNQINIYVKNSGIVDSTLQSNIKSTILQQSSTLLPVGVKINDIKFIDFK